PLSAVIMLENLAEKGGQEEKNGKEASVRTPTDLSLIHLITMTPDMALLYIQSADGWVEEFIDLNQSELFNEENYDYLLREAKTSAMLSDWIGEVKEELISDRYRIGPGDIRRSAETAEWLMHSLAELSKHLELGITFRAEQLSVRLHYGAGQDLLSLLDLKGVGRVRARKLHQSGITNREKLKSTDPAEVARLLGPKIAEKVLIQLAREERMDGMRSDEAVKGYGKDGEGEVNGITKNQGASEAQPPGVRPPANKTKARRSKQGRLP
ncbi:MAG: ATP-dependent helicase, partial [Euryarchaeota archaeon]|nr:ATP-dependent helicase [Euryarchaeota archaeon]